MGPFPAERDIMSQQESIIDSTDPRVAEISEVFGVEPTQVLSDAQGVADATGEPLSEVLTDLDAVAEMLSDTDSL